MRIGPNRIREIPELVLTTASKFRVSFVDLVDMERNFATMELTHYRDKKHPVGARHLEQLRLSNAFARGLSSASICWQTPRW